jgi:hypothetical protein
MGLFRKKGAKITVRSEVVDVAGLEGLGEEIMETLKAHGIEPGTSTVIDASDVPGLNKEIMEALGQAGVWQQAFGALETPVAPESDPVDQLERLAELHKKGVLSDYEFAFAKEKLLGQSWNDSAG